MALPEIVGHRVTLFGARAPLRSTAVERAAHRLSWRDRLLVGIAPALLVAVSVVHQVRVRSLEQSSWHGAGFGMFATFDAAHTRVVLAWDDRSGERLAVGGIDATTAARIVPSQANARAVALAVADRSALAEGGLVRVEVRGVDVDARTDEVVVTTRTLVEVVVEVES
jgi:hypothetical protein